MTARISKTSYDADIATLKLASHAEHCITVQSQTDMSRLLRRTAAELDATILSQFVFAGCRHYEDFRENAENAGWPVVWLQGDACRSGNMLSMQAFAVSGLVPEPVNSGGREVGFVYETEHARFCRLRGIQPSDVSAPRGEQARSAFEAMQAALSESGFAVTDTVRTWIYLDRLLEWYDEFNTVRTLFFRQHGIFEALVPASTGIGARNPFGAAVLIDVLAVQPKNGVTVQAVPSPLQNPATDYKSSFSRAVEMAFPSHRALYISGTASIDARGQTVHRNDPAAQIDRTLEVIEALLQSRGMAWSDLFRGIAYFKNMSDLPSFEQCCRVRQIPRFPLAVSHADICRDDLLFEIEVDAVKVA